MEPRKGALPVPQARTPLVRVTQNPAAAYIVITRCRKLYVGGRRIHHGLTGSALIGAGLLLHRKSITAIGTLLVLHDRHDFPFPLTDPVGKGPR